MTNQKSRIRISLRMILILIALVAIGLYFMDFNQSRILYGHKTAAFSYGGFNVDSQFDIQNLEKTLNSKPWRMEFRRQHPEHTRLINSWRPGKHGFAMPKIQNVSSITFSVHVQSPMYCVRLRSFHWRWPPYTDKFIENGEDGIEKKVGDLNGEFYLQLMEAVTNTVHDIENKE